MSAIHVALYPVSFVLEAGAPRFVTLCQEDGSPLARRVHGDLDETARSLLADTIDHLGKAGLADAPARARDDLKQLSSRFLAVTGANTSGAEATVIYTASIPTPLAEDELDITFGSSYTWRTLSMSRPRRTHHATPDRRTGPDAVVLDYWRQAFEETDLALDFLPQHLSLLQLRSLYDAVWGYDQDPSGFKRWAIDRTGAFRELLEEVDVAGADGSFFASLGHQLPPEMAAKAGALTTGLLAAAIPPALGLPIGIAAAASINRLYPRRGPEPTWFRKTAVWRQGPTWIEHLYPPRPSWTLWETGRDGNASDT